MNKVPYGFYCVLLGMCFFALRRRPHIALELSVLPKTGTSYRLWIERYRFLFPACALVLLLAAPMAPHTSSTTSLSRHTLPAILLAIDTSSSMAEQAQGQGTQCRKIDIARTHIKYLIDTMPQCAFGLMTFARRALMICPLTMARTALIEETNKITPTSDASINGTALGYALFKTTLMFQAIRMKNAERGQSLQPTVVLFTDGLERIHPDDGKDLYRAISLKPALEYAQRQGVRVYIVVVDAVFMNSDFQRDRIALQQLCRTTGGDAIVLTSSQQFANWKEQTLTTHYDLPRTQPSTPSQTSYILAAFIAIMMGYLALLYTKPIP